MPQAKFSCPRASRPNWTRPSARARLKPSATNSPFFCPHAVKTACWSWTWPTPCSPPSTWTLPASACPPCCCSAPTYRPWSRPFPVLANRPSCRPSATACNAWTPKPAPTTCPAGSWKTAACPRPCAKTTPCPHTGGRATVWQNPYPACPGWWPRACPLRSWRPSTRISVKTPCWPPWCSRPWQASCWLPSGGGW